MMYFYYIIKILKLLLMQALDVYENNRKNGLKELCLCIIKLYKLLQDC